LIQGKYIDYSQIIPKEAKTKVEIDRLTLLEALERAFVIASSSANIIKIEILDSDSKILITATNNELGDASDTLEVNVEGEKQKTIAFNVRLLMDVLKNLENEKIIVKLTGDTNPAVITEDLENEEYLYVLMPLKAVE
jgi:DNA polymerase-3 subunit beta